jgi:hypothetical protein
MPTDAEIARAATVRPIAESIDLDGWTIVGLQ